MKDNNSRGGIKRVLYITFVMSVLLLSSFSLYLASAAPQGATIEVASVVVDSGPVKNPSFRNDSGGKIITLRIQAEQQDYSWKAYVGNVSGSFVLQNVNNASIYEWPSVTVATGELYISRNATINWSAVGCADQADMIAEQTFLGMAGTDLDNINNTFNSTLHKSFTVGTNPIAENQCPAIATWVNDAPEAPGATATFQEVLLHDNKNLIYSAFLNDNEQGFDSSSIYDFQAIIAENDTSIIGTAYYFFLELGN